MKGAQRYARSNEPQRHWILSKHEAKDAKVKETRKPESRMRRQVSRPVRRGARRKGQQWTSLVAYPAVIPPSMRPQGIPPTLKCVDGGSGRIVSLWRQSCRC